MLTFKLKQMVHINHPGVLWFIIKYFFYVTLVANFCQSPKNKLSLQTSIVVLP